MSSRLSIMGLDDKQKRETLLIHSLTAEAEALITAASSREMADEVRLVYEAFRYSDPVSDPALREINAQLQREFSEFSKAVLSEDLDLTRAIGRSLIALTEQRNIMCRTAK